MLRIPICFLKDVAPTSCVQSPRQPTHGAGPGHRPEKHSPGKTQALLLKGARWKHVLANTVRSFLPVAWSKASRIVFVRHGLSEEVS